MRNILYIPLLCLLTLKVGFAQNPAILQVNLAKPGAPIQPTMWGIFFEDINFGADGGIYAELVKNRSFEFYQPLMGWKTEKTAETSGSVLVQNRGTDLPNPRFVRIQKKSEKGKLGLSNGGFRGMGFRQGESYVFSLESRVPEGTAPISLRIELLSPEGAIIGNTQLLVTGKDWKSQHVTLTCNQTTPRGSLVLWIENVGTVDLDMISLFPSHTWKNRPGGLRPDLVQLLADLKPGFLRFPGGCIVEGRELNTRYQWKKTVGPIQQREMIVNRWNTEFNHRLTPDYFQTFGLGFYEYFLLSEDIGAEPLPILNCGMACQFNSGEVVPMDDLDPYIQDALDLIEFANGSVQSTWGKLRADMGHPQPFDMKFLGVGNEQWGEQYIERYIAFEKILRAKHPEIKLISAVGPFPDGEQFDYLSKEMQALKADLVDEHYYRSPEWFLQHADRYDAYDRSGPRIFAGEYAAQSIAIASPDNKNNWRCALAEAAFMTGLERNADLVHMASYAPLFAHTEGWQWTPNLIWFDNLSSYGTPNYYVQQLFSVNKGSRVLPIAYGGQVPQGKDGIYASAVLDEYTGEMVVKVVNAAAQTKKLTLLIDGVKKDLVSVQVQVLSSPTYEGVNALDNPKAIAPVTGFASIVGKSLQMELPASSLNVFRVR